MPYSVDMKLRHGSPDVARPSALVAASVAVKGTAAAASDRLHI